MDRCWTKVSKSTLVLLQSARTITLRWLKYELFSGLHLWRFVCVWVKSWRYCFKHIFRNIVTNIWPFYIKRFLKGKKCCCLVVIIVWINLCIFGGTWYDTPENHFAFIFLYVINRGTTYTSCVDNKTCRIGTLQSISFHQWEYCYKICRLFLFQKEGISMQICVTTGYQYKYVYQYATNYVEIKGVKTKR